jgi:exosortase
MQTANTTEKVDTGSWKESFRIADLKSPLLVPICLNFVVLLWLYLPTFHWWSVEWMKEDSYYQHAPLIPFISLFVVWLKRKQLLALPVKPWPAGYFLVVPGILIAVMMTWAGAKEVQGLVFPIILTGMIMVLFGQQIVRELRFPLAYLYFMVVLPGDVLAKLSFKIQLLSTIGAVGFLKLIGFDVNRVGVKIELPSVDVLVGGPCSGFRLLISLFALTILFVYLAEGRKFSKSMLVILMFPFSIVLNAIRITMIALVGEKWGYETMQSFHDYSGYIMLLLAFALLWALAGVFKCRRLNSMLTP